MAVIKYSRQRESIKTNLIHRNDHPTADMIYTDMRVEYPNISLGTVYRNLALLSEIGEIRKISSIDGPDRYDGTTIPHNHFVCRKCGKIVDVMKFVVDDLISDVASEVGGTVEDCCITFTGLCEQCKDKE